MGEATTGATREDALRATLDAAIAAHDRSAAVTAALAAVDVGEITVPDLYVVLSALLVDVGGRWQSGGVAIWEEHLASSTVRTIIEALYPRVSALADARGRDRGTLLLTCPPHEAHDLGLRMLADRLELAGWRVFFLGADTPEADIVAAALTLKADTVVLSLSTHFHCVAFRSVLATLRKGLPGVRILAGGPAVPRGTQDIADDDRFDAADFLGPGE